MRHKAQSAYIRHIRHIRARTEGQNECITMDRNGVNITGQYKSEQRRYRNGAYHRTNAVLQQAM